MLQTSSRVRVRQHINPLRKELQVPAPPLNWEMVYTDSTAPLVVDLGAGYGRFLLALATEMSKHNMLGLEIRGAVSV